jgi:hypothetical protein
VLALAAEGAVQKLVGRFLVSHRRSPFVRA